MPRVMYCPRHAEDSQETQNQIHSKHVHKLIEQCVTLKQLLQIICL